MNLVPNAELFFLEKKKLVRKSTHELFANKDVLIDRLILTEHLYQQMKRWLRITKNYIYTLKIQH